MKKIPTVKVVVINKTALTIKVTIPGTTRYKFKNLNQAIDLKQWDSKAGLCKKGHKDSEYINRCIFEERNSIVQAFEEDLKKGIVFTEAHISHRLAGIYLDVTKDFYAFCEDQIATINYSSETRRTYKSEVSKIKLHYPSLSFADINYSWLQKYEQYMRTTLSNHDNTVWKSLKFINTMLNLAIKHGGIIEKNPMADYDRGQYKQGIPLYLEWPEVQKLHDAIANKAMTDYTRLIGYYSLLSYYTGLRFGDAVKFDYKKKVIDGNRIVLSTQKTGNMVSISFTKYIKEVVEYIKDRPITITNQEFNENLKIIRGIAGIGKDISSHTGRHSFAMRCAELGMSIDEVQKLLGHNKRTSTEIYFKIQNKRLDEAMSKWDE